MFLALIVTAAAGDLRIDSAGSFVVVSVDGKLAGTTPLELPKVEAGSHELGFWASATDGEPVFVQQVQVPEVGAVFVTVDFVSQTVDVENARPEPVQATETTSARRPVGRLAAAGGVTALGVGAGAGAAMSYLQARTAYQRFLEVPSDDLARVVWEDDVRPAKVRAGALGAVGAVALASGVGLFVSTDVGVVPGPGGLIVTGRF